jgi:hypothetical protein
MIERKFGRKTLEVEILKEALGKSRSKKPAVLAQSLKRYDLPSGRLLMSFVPPDPTCITG